QAALYTDLCTWALETCANGRDDDCNGVIDDPEQCALCVPNAPSELCDGADNNCDGLIDEYFVCDDTGRPSCAPCTSSLQCRINARCRSAPDFAGTWCFDECGAGCAPGTTCDGEVCVLNVTSDVLSCLDVLGCGAGASCGLYGVCAGTQGACINDVWVCARSPEWQAEETRCDGLDNDCDQLVDEHPLCAAREARLAEMKPEACAGAPAGVAWLAVLLSRRRRR
ncbi:MAG: hypothetical protein HYZ27_08155, partial [Deltaproteobacteria bacterium]|nr:hypothetical protein [Deltaproteobacteria bacterium]